MERYIPIADEQKIASFPAVLAEMIGGADVVEMVIQYFEDDMSFRQIADVHAEPEPSVRRWIKQARTKMRRCGVFPAQWETSSQQVNP